MTPCHSPAAVLSLALARLGLLLGLNLCFVAGAHAVPSFARQTGEECGVCHVGAFGPQLTPYGQSFKLSGYTDAKDTKFRLPLSGMVVANWTHTSKDQVPAPDHFDPNDNAVFQEVSLFLAGRLTPNIGAFVQGTYSGVDRVTALDQADIRLAHHFEWNDKDLLLGLSLNNNPTITNPNNTMGAWRFPYTAADLAPAPANTTMLDDMLGQQVAGLNGYALLDHTWYAEFGGYKTLSVNTLQSLNDLQDPEEDVGRINNIAPYWRLSWMKDAGTHSMSLGLFGMVADIKPDRTSGGPYDKYRDIGIDGSWELVGTGNDVFTMNGSYTHETRNADFSGNGSGHLNRLDLNACWHHNKAYGLTGGLFDVKGSENAALWETDSGKPDSNGYIVQADWTPFGKHDSWNAPWANVRLGLQYTGYNRFDGTSKNAGDNNSLSAFAWFSF